MRRIVLPGKENALWGFGVWEVADMCRVSAATIQTSPERVKEALSQENMQASDAYHRTC